MNIDTVIRYLDDETTYQSNWSDGYVKTSLRMQPERYIEYAQQDLLNAHPRGTINALSNVKRALFCQLDRLLKLLGYHTSTSDSYPMDYLSKVSRIRSYGIAIPEKLNEVTKTRNLMEHHYREPTTDAIRELLQDVTDFIQSTSFYASRFPARIEYSNHLKQEVYGFYNLTLYVNQGEKCIYVTSGEEKTAVKGKSPQYIEVYKRHLQLSKRYATAMETKSVNDDTG